MRTSMLIILFLYTYLSPMYGYFERLEGSMGMIHMPAAIWGENKVYYTHTDKQGKTFKVYLTLEEQELLKKVLNPTHKRNTEIIHKVLSDFPDKTHQEIFTLLFGNQSEQE